MRKFLAIFALLVVSVVSPAKVNKKARNAPPAGNAIYCNPLLVEGFWQIWSVTAGGMAGNGEREAGFRIDWINNHLELGPIIMGTESLRLTIPIGNHTIAIAHLHPSRGVTAPSDIDMKNMQPDYVVARDGLWLTVPTEHRYRHLRPFPDLFKADGCRVQPDTTPPPAPDKKHWWS